MNGSRKAVLLSSLLGIPAGLVWLWWAEPAQWLMTEQGLVMTEGLAVGQFDVVATYSIIGLIVGIFIGIIVVLMVRPVTSKLVALAVGSSLLAAFECWVIAQLFGPGDPSRATGAELGELVSERFIVDTWSAFLVWPFGALVVLVVTTYMSEDQPTTSVTSEFVPPSPE